MSLLSFFWINSQGTEIPLMHHTFDYFSNNISQSTEEIYPAFWKGRTQLIILGIVLYIFLFLGKILSIFPQRIPLCWMAV